MPLAEAWAIPIVLYPRCSENRDSTEDQELLSAVPPPPPLIGQGYAPQAWGHDAFFDYVDRWMYEDDDAFVKTIKETTRRDHDKEWARQGQSRDMFVNEMWAKHRPALQAPTDWWKEKHD